MLPQHVSRMGGCMSTVPMHRSYSLVKVGVVGVGVLLVALFVMSAVSVIVGVLWTVAKVVLAVVLVAGVMHLARHWQRRDELEGK